MQDREATRRALEEFSAHYDYDNEYLVALLEASPGAYAAFAAAEGLAQYRGELPHDALWIASLATHLADGCGPCAQLNLKLAAEAGVARELLATVLEAPEQLPHALADVAAHARAVCEGAPDDPERAARLRRVYGEAGFAELALRIVGARLYPMLKRALAQSGVCQKPSLAF